MKNAKSLKNSRGSALVGAIALAILMAIAGIGFLQVSTTNVNSETAALENEKAFQAAESGIWVAARWLRANLTSATTVLSPPNGPYASTAISINGLNVFDSIKLTGTTPPVLSISATVYKGASKSSFKRRINVGNVTIQTFGSYGTFFNGYQATMPALSWVAGAWGAPTLEWNGWGSNRVFNGRVHMNRMPNRLLDNTARFNGLVTVARGNDGLGPGFETGNNGNNYDSGITLAYTPTNTMTDLNNIFTNRYIGNVDTVALNIPQTDATSLDAVLTAANKYDLTASTRDDGYKAYQYRPTLYFDGQNAFYQYKNAGGSYVVDTFGALKGGTIDGKVFIASNNLNVYTTSTGVTGRVTVATPTGKSIVPVGNITTSDYNFTTGTIPSNSNNMIGLISGAYVAFDKTWIKHFKGAVGTSADTQYVSSQVTGGGSPGPSDGVGTMHISAAIIAVSKFTDSLYLGSAGAVQNFPMSGTEWWDGMWGDYPPGKDPSGNPLGSGTAFNSMNNKCEDYTYQLYGNHILGGYSRTVYGGQTAWRGCAGTTIWNQDMRMTDRNLQPPGFPGVANNHITGTSTISLLTLRMRNWSESNTF